MNVLIVIIVYGMIALLYKGVDVLIKEIKYKESKPRRSNFNSYDEYFKARTNWVNKR